MSESIQMLKRAIQTTQSVHKERTGGKGPVRYSPDVVKRATDYTKAQLTAGKGFPEIGEQLLIHENTLRRWTRGGGAAGDGGRNPSAQLTPRTVARQIVASQKTRMASKRATTETEIGRASCRERV